jgi:hypothetical protein
MLLPLTWFHQQCLHAAPLEQPTVVCRVPRFLEEARYCTALSLNRRDLKHLTEPSSSSERARGGRALARTQSLEKKALTW